MTGPGRRTSARGEHRRRLLLDAAGALLMEQGFAAVSHRAVAQRAALPLAATTYYFASLDELLEQTVQALAQQWLAAARDVVSGLPERLRGSGEVTGAVLRVAAPVPATGDRPDALLTMYERYLEAGRHPGLRAAVAAYDAELDSLLGEVLRRGGLPDAPAAARLVLAVVDGALLRALAEGRPVSSATAPVEELLRSLGRTRD